MSEQDRCYTCNEKLSGKNGINTVHDVTVCNFCFKFSRENILIVCKICGSVYWTEKNKKSKMAIMRNWSKFRQYEKARDGSIIERHRFGEESFVTSLLKDDSPSIISVLCSEACMKKYAYKMANEYNKERREYLDELLKYAEETHERIISLVR